MMTSEGPTYPNLGVDDRSQFDIFRALPGGLDALRSVTAELKARGVRVLWPYLTWDTYTNREPNGAADEDTIVAMLKATGGAGFNGDSIPFVPKKFWDASVKAGYPLALQAEGGTQDPALSWSTLGWGYWGRQSNPSDAAGYNWTYGTVPLVDRFKFDTKSQYMTNMCERYATNKTNNLQHAWFNGDGYESWENVWGMWNMIVQRDGEALRRVAAMLRFWGSRGALNSPYWEPHDPVTIQYGVYASKWPMPARNATLWTIVNRAGFNLTGAQVKLPGPRTPSATVYYDCYHGTELEAEDAGNAAITLSFELEAGGFGCVVEVAARGTSSYNGSGGTNINTDTNADANADADSDAARAGADEDPAFAAYMSTMENMTHLPLASFSTAWSIPAQHLVDYQKRTPTLASTAPPGTVYVPRAVSYTFHVSGVEIEGVDRLGVDVQFPWETSPQKSHDQKLAIGPFYIDRFPVTNTNYSAYLASTGYAPKDPHNWLKNWNVSTLDAPRAPPERIADMPVTWVGLAEARAFCAWAHGGNSRLPHSYEWQYAAQGTDGRKYPWGSKKDQSKFPTPQMQMNGKPSYTGPERVDAYPAGASPFGVQDMVGNTWEYTDEFVDVHTRAAILRGGSNYKLPESSWYFRQALELNTHNKYLLMDSSYERAATIGFRCLVDAAK